MIADPLVQTDENVNTVFKTSTLKWMQFTGLHDKNGKEIYEGDIVQFNMPLAENPQVRKIIYSTRHAGFVVNSGDYFPREDWNIEVIGNIYENPELLNTKTAR